MKKRNEELRYVELLKLISLKSGFLNVKHANKENFSDEEFNYLVVKNLDSLLSIISNLAEEVNCLKAILSSVNNFDEHYKRERIKAKIETYNSAGEIGNKNLYPYKVDDNYFFKHILNLSDSEIDEVQEKIEQVKMNS